MIWFIGLPESIVFGHRDKFVSANYEKLRNLDIYSLIKEQKFDRHVIFSKNMLPHPIEFTCIANKYSALGNEAVNPHLHG